MIHTSTSLLPDDEQPTRIDLVDRHYEPVQPHAFTATLVALLVLIITRGIFATWPLMALLALATFTGILGYNVLIVTRLRPRIIGINIAAALIAAAYSLPIDVLSKPFWQDSILLVTLATMLIGAGIIGLLIGRSLQVERTPNHVIAITFLAVFVVMNLRLL